LKLESHIIRGEDCENFTPHIPLYYSTLHVISISLYDIFEKFTIYRKCSQYVVS